MVILRAIPMNILMAILMFTFTAIPMAFISDFPSHQDLHFSWAL